MAKSGGDTPQGTQNGQSQTIGPRRRRRRRRRRGGGRADVEGLPDTLNRDTEDLNCLTDGDPVGVGFVGVPVPLILVDGESLHETLFWLSQPGIHESLGEAEADIGAALVRCRLAWPCMCRGSATARTLAANFDRMPIDRLRRLA